MADIVVPSLGESVTEATVAQWMKKPGDRVAKDEPVVELETDKVTLEVAAPEDGVLGDIVAEEGATVEIGAILGHMDGAGAGASAPAPSPAPAAAPSPSPAPAPTPSPQPASGNGASAVRSTGEIIDVAIPQMGESVAEGTIGTWLVKPGQRVKADDPIVEIETDKVSVEVPAPQDGVIAELMVNEGDTVGVGTVVARLEAGAGGGQSARATPAPSPSPEPFEREEGRVDASSPSGRPMPSARRVMAENDLSSEDVRGTGRGGRITKADALQAVEKAGSASPSPSPQATALRPANQEPRELRPREERVRMTRLRQTIARRLKEAQNTAAMLTTYNDVDMTAVMATRKKFKDEFAKKHGIKLGFMSFFVKAVIQALQDVPAVNAEIDGDSIIYKNYFDIGVAVSSDRGLVVPVVRNADQLSLGGIEMAIADLSTKAREGKLQLDEMQGATFTVTNGGVFGSLMSTPILNAPQSGILGMHRIEERPVVVDGDVVARPMMYLALTYDHRIIDGKEAVTFLVRVKECIEDPERLVLDL